MSGYGSTIREMMKKSMERPAEFKPLNRRRGWWDRNSEVVGAFLWCGIVAAVGVGILLVYGIR
jgi:hypothetical protein